VSYKLLRTLSQSYQHNMSMENATPSGVDDFLPDVSDDFIEGGVASVLSLRDEMSSLAAERGILARVEEPRPSVARSTLFPLTTGEAPLPPSILKGPVTPDSRPRSIASEKEEGDGKRTLRRDIAELTTRVRHLDSAVMSLNRATSATSQLATDAIKQSARERSEARKDGATIAANVDALIDRVARLEDLIELAITDIRGMVEAMKVTKPVSAQEYEIAERGDGPAASSEKKSTIALTANEQVRSLTDSLVFDRSAAPAVVAQPFVPRKSAFKF